VSWNSPLPNRKGEIPILPKIKLIKFFKRDGGTPIPPKITLVEIPNLGWWNSDSTNCKSEKVILK